MSRVEASRRVAILSAPFVAGHPPSRSSWRCQAYLWPDLRGDPRCAQDLPRERMCSPLNSLEPLTDWDPLQVIRDSVRAAGPRLRHAVKLIVVLRVGHVHGARQEEDRHGSRCRLRPQALRPYPLRFRCLSSSASGHCELHGSLCGRRCVLIGDAADESIMTAHVVCSPLCIVCL